MTTCRSMTDVAYEMVSKKKRAVPFLDLWKTVEKTCGVSEDSIAQFYTDLTLDNRFVNMEGNKWDLKERKTFDECHIDMSAIELDEDEPEEGSEDDSDMRVPSMDEEY